MKEYIIQWVNSKGEKEHSGEFTTEEMWIEQAISAMKNIPTDCKIILFIKEEKKER